MKTKLFLSVLLAFIMFRSTFFGQNRQLYAFKAGNLWGYMNSNGKVVIKPRFYSAGQFSQGLAPVRINGTYGFIDQSGNISIKPVFDLALPFEYGIAKVFIEGKPFFIDVKGTNKYHLN